MTKKQISEYREKSKDMQERIFERFADMVISKMETIRQDWKKPWFCAGSTFAPVNLSGRNYNGMNSLMLMLYCEEKGYEYPVFCTFDRVEGLNYSKDKQGKRNYLTDENGEKLPAVHVRKGEKSFPVFLTCFTVVHKTSKEKIPYDEYKKLGDSDRDNYNVFPKLQVYHVFNIDQTNMKEVRPEMYEQHIKDFKRPERTETEAFSFAPIDSMLEKQSWVCPIETKYGDDAYYSISKDMIVIPEKKQFRDGESFYSNLLHEMAHSTGAESRLNRLKPTSFGSKEYAREELVAELSAAFVSTKHHITKHIKDDSAAYLKSWIDSMKEEPNYIKSVLLDVKRCTSFIEQNIPDVE